MGNGIHLYASPAVGPSALDGKRKLAIVYVRVLVLHPNTLFQSVLSLPSTLIILFIDLILSSRQPDPGVCLAFGLLSHLTPELLLT